MTEYPAIEPITYRWRQRGAELWIYDPTPEWVKDHAHEVEIEPVYSCDQVGNLRSQLVSAKSAMRAIIDANKEFRAGLPDDWEGDPLQDAIDAANFNVLLSDDLGKESGDPLNDGRNPNFNRVGGLRRNDD